MNVKARTRPAVHPGLFFTVGCILLTGCGSGHLTPASSNTPSNAGTAAIAQQGPQMGFLWSASEQTLRSIQGVPGASQFGPPMLQPGQYVAAGASARSGAAILEDKAGDVSLMSVASGQPQPLAGVHISGTAQFVFSPSGANAVIFVPGQNAAFLLTGLAGLEQPSPQVQVQGLASASALQAVAVSDMAQVVGAASASGPTTLTLLTGNAAPVATLGGFGGIAFLPGGSDLLAVDSAHSVVNLIPGNGAAAQSFASSALRAPFAVAASQDGRTAVVANGGDASVIRLDLTNAANQMRIPCSCKPDRLMPLAGNAVFALTGPGTTTAWMVDAAATVPHTLFIPAMVKE